MRSTSILSAVAALVATAVADFYIYEMDTIAADPYAGGGMSAIFQHLVCTLKETRISLAYRRRTNVCIL